MFDFRNHRKAALLFSGGPAPSANAVISSVALNFINARVPIIGFFFGFEFLEDYDKNNRCPRLRLGLRLLQHGENKARRSERRR